MEGNVAKLTLKGLKKRFHLVDHLCHPDDGRLTCRICHDILEDPCLTPCGCRFCYSCICTRLEGPEERFCPDCKGAFDSSEVKLTEDRLVAKEIAYLLMICANKECRGRCMLKDLEDHLKGCEFRNETCADCEKEYFHKDFKEHQRRECPMRKVTCVDCGSRMTKEDFKRRHRSTNDCLEGMCDQWKGVCPYRCSLERQDSIKDHLMECPKMHVGCDLKVVGCLKVLPREEMAVHCISDLGPHLVLVARELVNMRKVMEDMKDALSEAQETRVREDYEMNQTLTNLKKVERTHFEGEEMNYAMAETNMFGRKFLRLEGVERNLKTEVDVLSTLNDDSTFEDLVLIFTLYHIGVLLVLRTEVLKKNVDLFSKILSLGWKHHDLFGGECLYVVSSEGATLISESDLSMSLEDFGKAKDVDGGLWISLEIDEVPIVESGL